LALTVLASLGEEMSSERSLVSAYLDLVSPKATRTRGLAGKTGAFLIAQSLSTEAMKIVADSTIRQVVRQTPLVPNWRMSVWLVQHVLPRSG